MKRWLWNIFCALSLLIFAASVTLWIRSYFIGEIVECSARQIDSTGQSGPRLASDYVIQSSRGAISLALLHTQDARFFTGPWQTLHRRWDLVDTLLESHWRYERINVKFLGFQVLYYVLPEVNGSTSSVKLVLPLWLFLIFALPPVMWWRKRRKLAGRGFPLQPIAKTESPSPS